MTICLDSYGWIEILAKGPKAEAYGRAIASAPPDQIITSVVSLYEVYKKAKRTRGEPAALEDVAVMGHTHVVGIDRELALDAADLSMMHDLHFADALIYATARRFHADLWTSDAALKGLPSVHFV